MYFFVNVVLKTLHDLALRPLSSCQYFCPTETCNRHPLCNCMAQFASNNLIISLTHVYMNPHRIAPLNQALKCKTLSSVVVKTNI